MTRDHTIEARMPSKNWEPMRLEHVGSVAELMRDSETGSRRDSATQGCGGTRRRSGGSIGPC